MSGRRKAKPTDATLTREILAKSGSNWEEVLRFMWGAPKHRENQSSTHQKAWPFNQRKAS